MKKSYKKTLIYLLTIFAVGLVSVNSFASTKSLSCNGCTAYQMETKASLDHHAIGSSYAVVFNFSDGYAKKYKRSLYFDNRGVPVRSVHETNLSADERHDVNLILDFRNDLKAALSNNNLPIFESTSLKSNYIGNPVKNGTNDVSYSYAGSMDVKGDPYTFLSVSSFRNDTFDYYMQHDSALFTELHSSTLNKVAIPNAKDMDLYIKINFFSSTDKKTSNGWLSVSLNFVTEEFIILGGKDADRNTVPLTKEKFVMDTFRVKNAENGERTILSYGSMLWSVHKTTCRVRSRDTRMVNGEEHVFYKFACG